MTTPSAFSHDQKILVNLILQDLRHHQLIETLHQAKLNADLHDLDLMEVVAQLMGIEPKRISDHWSEVYYRFMERATEYEVTGRGKALEPLAEECYRFLVAFTEMEGRPRASTR